MYSLRTLYNTCVKVIAFLKLVTAANVTHHCELILMGKNAVALKHLLACMFWIIVLLHDPIVHQLQFLD